MRISGVVFSVTISSFGVLKPMVPIYAVFSPRSFNNWYIRYAVVVLPFVPVKPIIFKVLILSAYSLFNTSFKYSSVFSTTSRGTEHWTFFSATTLDAPFFIATKI